MILVFQQKKECWESMLMMPMQYLKISNGLNRQLQYANDLENMKTTLHQRTEEGQCPKVLHSESRQQYSEMQPIWLVKDILLFAGLVAVLVRL